jgi:hypothetical protein
MPQKKSRRKATVKRVARVRRPAPKKPYAPSPRSDGEVHANGVLIGYARESTLDQRPTLQRDALNDAGCAKLFVSGAIYDRPGASRHARIRRAGDTIVLWKLDRLARSIKQLIETVDILRLRNIGLRSLTESIDPRRSSLTTTLTLQRRCWRTPT